MCLDRIADSLFVEVLYKKKCLPPASPLPSPPRKHLLHLVHWKISQLQIELSALFASFEYFIRWSSCQHFLHPLKVIELILENQISEIPRRYFFLLSSWRLSFSFVQYLWPESSQQTGTQHSRFAPSPLGRRVLTVAQGGEVYLAANVWGFHNPGKKKIETSLIKKRWITVKELTFPLVEDASLQWLRRQQLPQPGNKDCGKTCLWPN